jgi:hypothetical protein
MNNYTKRSIYIIYLFVSCNLICTCAYSDQNVYGAIFHDSSSGNMNVLLDEFRTLFDQEQMAVHLGENFGANITTSSLTGVGRWNDITATKLQAGIAEIDKKYSINSVLISREIPTTDFSCEDGLKVSIHLTNSSQIDIEFTGTEAIKESIPDNWLISNISDTGWEINNEITWDPLIIPANTVKTITYDIDPFDGIIEGGVISGSAGESTLDWFGVIAEREFSQDSYLDDDTITVTIHLTNASCSDGPVSIIEPYPEGWTIQNISDNGYVDGEKIHWDDFSIPIGASHDFSYIAQSPASPGEDATWGIGEIARYPQFNKKYGNEVTLPYGYFDPILPGAIFTNPNNNHLYVFLVEKGNWFTHNENATELGGYLVTINDSEENEWLKDTILQNELIDKIAWISWIGYTDKDEEGNWKWLNGETTSFENWISGSPGINNYKNYCQFYYNPNYDDFWSTDYPYTWIKSIVEIDPGNFKPRVFALRNMSQDSFGCGDVIEMAIHLNNQTSYDIVFDNSNNQKISDKIPEGWIADNISHSGIFDFEQSEIIWNITSPSQSTLTVHYDLIPSPENDIGIHYIEGIAGKTYVYGSNDLIVTRETLQDYFIPNDLIDVVLQIDNSSCSAATLVINETILEGWTVEKISNGGYVNGDKLRWENIVAPIGESSVSYTIKVPENPPSYVSWWDPIGLDIIDVYKKYQHTTAYLKNNAYLEYRSYDPVVAGAVFDNPDNGKKYVIFPEHKNWSQHEQTAVELGGHLATINDQDENDWITSTISTNLNNRFHSWIGYTDQYVEGVWEWISGESHGYENWAVYEPEYDTQRNHALIRTNPCSLFGLWFTKAANKVEHIDDAYPAIAEFSQTEFQPRIFACRTISTHEFFCRDVVQMQLHINNCTDVDVEFDDSDGHEQIVEVFPEGWNATNISDAGQLVGNTLIWNLAISAHSTYTLSYDLIPSPDHFGDAEFTGTAGISRIYGPRLYSERLFSQDYYAADDIIDVTIQVKNTVCSESPVDIYEEIPLQWSVDHISHNGYQFGNQIIWKNNVLPYGDVISFSYTVTVPSTSTGNVNWPEAHIHRDPICKMYIDHPYSWWKHDADILKYIPPLQPLSSPIGIFDQYADWYLFGYEKEFGSASFDGTTYNLQGNGNDIYLDEDEGYFLYTERTGNWNIQSKVQWIDPGDNSGAKLGVMVRENGQDPESKHQTVVLLGDNSRSSTQYRTVHGKTTGDLSHNVFDEGNGIYYRVTRVDELDVCFSEISADGINWSFGTSTNIDMESTAAYGLVITNHNDNTLLASGSADDVIIEPLDRVVAKRTLDMDSIVDGDVLRVTIEVFSPFSNQTIEIHETVPQDLMIISVENGGIISDNTITWNNADISMGTSTLVYYVESPISNEKICWEGTVNELPIFGDDSVSLPQNFVVYSPKVNNTITLDGIIDPNEWSGAYIVNFDCVDTNVPGVIVEGSLHPHEESNTTLYTLHSDDYIYFALDVVDFTPDFESGTDGWVNDSAELMLDGNFSQHFRYENNYYGFQAAVLGNGVSTFGFDDPTPLTDDNGVSYYSIDGRYWNYGARAKPDGTGYTVEFQVTKREILSPLDRKRVAFDIGINSGNGTGVREYKYALNMTDMYGTVREYWNDETGWVELQLLDSTIGSRPEAFDVSETVSSDSSILLTLMGTDADNDSLNYIFTSLPSHGTLTNYDSDSGTVEYTPDRSFGGIDSFRYTASDGIMVSDHATVHITVIPVDTPTSVQPSNTPVPPTNTPVPNSVLIVTRNIIDGGSTFPSGTSMHKVGDTIQLVASVSSGFVFSGWSVLDGSSRIDKPNSSTTSARLDSKNVTIMAYYTNAPTSTPIVDTATPLPEVTATPTQSVISTTTPLHSSTETPAQTNTPAQDDTNTPTPIGTDTPEFTHTPLPENVDTPTPLDTNTPTQLDTETPTLLNTDTPIPTPSYTPTPITPTDTPTPEPVIIVTVSDNESSFNDISGDHDIDNSDSRELTIRWNLSLIQPPVSSEHIKFMYIFVSIDGGSRQFLKYISDPSTSYFTWSSSTGASGSFASGPLDGHSYEFSIYLDTVDGPDNFYDSSGSIQYSIIFPTDTITPENSTDTPTPENTNTPLSTNTPTQLDTPSLVNTNTPTQLDTPSLVNTNTPTQLDTPSSVSTNTPAPSDTPTIESIQPTDTATQESVNTVTPIPSIPVLNVLSVDEQNSKGILLNWDYNGIEPETIMDAHLYVKVNDGESVAGGVHIGDGYYFLCNTGSGVINAIYWSLFQTGIHPAFKDGPIQGNHYQFILFFLTHDGQSIVSSDSLPLLYEIKPFPSSIITASTTDMGIKIEWELSGIDLNKVRNFHIYTRVNDSDPVSGSESINGYHYLGKTQANHDTQFTWELGNPNISHTFSSGPVFGNFYMFRLIPISVDGTPLPSLDTENPLLFDIQSKTPTMSAFEDETGIHVNWSLDGIEPSNISTIHLYAKVNGGDQFVGFNQIDNFYFLYRIPDRTLTNFTWSANLKGVPNNFILGPQFGNQYEFKLFVLDHTNQIICSISTETEISFSFKTFENPYVVKVTDDLDTIDDLSFRIDSDFHSESALMIHWDYNNADSLIDPSSVDETHILVSKDNGPFEFLKRIEENDSHSFRWSNNSSANFLNGPEYFHSYQFRVVAFTSVLQNSKIGFTHLGPVRYESNLKVTDTNLTVEDVSNNTGYMTGEDIDEEGNRSLALHWDLRNEIDNVSDIQFIHFYVEIDGMDKQFLCSISNDRITDKGTYVWKKGGSRLTSDFVNGPLPRKDNSIRTFKFWLMVKLLDNTYLKNESGIVYYQ